MIVKLHKRDRRFYVIMDNRPLNNPALSWKAKGLLAYLLSKTDDWIVRMDDLVQKSTGGAGSVRSALKELQKAGHARLETPRAEKGTLWGKQWVILEEPATDIAETPISAEPDFREMPIFGKSNPIKEGEETKDQFSLSNGGKPGRVHCTQKECEDFCESIGLPRSDGEAMFLHWEEKGWAKVKDWQLTIRKWKSFGYMPSQKHKGHGTTQRPNTGSVVNAANTNRNTASQY